MKTKTLTCLLVFVSMFSVRAQTPPEIYFAEDVSPYGIGGPNQVPRPSYPQSQAAAAQFLARLQGATTESFEGLATGSLPTTLGFGTNTATLSVSSSNVCAVQTVVDPATTDGGWFPTTGTNFLGLDIGRTNQTDKYFRIEFSSPQAAFGFYGTDVELNQFRLRFVRTDGSTNDVLVPLTEPQGSGGVFYFGMIDRDRPFVSVWFENLGQQPDGMGFDNLTVGTPEQVLSLPTLSISRSNTAVIVSWTLPAEGWVLEATNAIPQMSAPWPQIPPPYQTNSANAQFTEPAPSGNKFYRLHKP